MNFHSLLLCGAFNCRQSNAVEDELKNSVGFLLQYSESNIFGSIFFISLFVALDFIRCNMFQF